MTISSGRESKVMFEDVPQLCTIEILLRKTDADTGENKPQGVATFRGARFTVKYYDGLWEEDTDPEKLGRQRNGHGYLRRMKTDNVLMERNISYQEMRYMWI